MSTTTYSPITIEPETRPVVVHFHDNIIASSTRVLSLREGSREPVLYIPETDVATEFLLPTEHRTTCPHKGEASYWTISAGGRAAENAVWSYRSPKPDVADIAGHLAFYPDKVRIEVG